MSVIFAKWNSSGGKQPFLFLNFHLGYFFHSYNLGTNFGLLVKLIAHTCTERKSKHKNMLI